MPEGPEVALRPHLEAALAAGADHVLVVSPSEVATAPWVRMKCQFGCANFGRSLCCPPHTPDPERMRGVLDSYRTAILLHRHVPSGRAMVDAFNELATDLERALFFAGYYKAWATGSGPCTRCKECNVGSPCRHAHRARPSMEACGIDVFGTARAHGLPISTLHDRSEERDFFTLVLVD
jgi:predicted metal-binding protein